MVDRFREWFAHEQACNERILSMLATVPQERRSEPRFGQAVALMAHLMHARLNWFRRITLPGEPQLPWFPNDLHLEDLPQLVGDVEGKWSGFLTELTEQRLGEWFDYGLDNGNRYSGTIEMVLTQLNGHHWYHRGQIALLVEQLGGETVDTDYVFWKFATHGDPRPLP